MVFFFKICIYYNKFDFNLKVHLVRILVTILFTVSVVTVENIFSFITSMYLGNDDIYALNSLTEALYVE